MTVRFPLVVTLALAGSAVLLSHAVASEPGPHHPPPPPPPKSGPPKPPVHHDPPKPVPPTSDSHSMTEVRGTLSSVDPTGKSLVITPTSGPAVKLQVDDKTHLALDGKPATLPDLAGDIGKPAGAVYDSRVTPPVARLIHVLTKLPSDPPKPPAHQDPPKPQPPVHHDPPKPEPPTSDTHSFTEVRGTLTSVDQTGKSVVITPEGKPGVKLQVDDKTLLVIAGKPATLADLAGAVGKAAGASYDSSLTPPVARLVLVLPPSPPDPPKPGPLASGPPATGQTGETPEKGDSGTGTPAHSDPPKPAPPTDENHNVSDVRGTLTSVDQTGNSVVITSENGKGVKLQVDDKTHILVDGKPVGLGDLAGVVGKPAGAIFDRSVTPPVARLIVVLMQWKGHSGAP